LNGILWLLNNLAEGQLQLERELAAERAENDRLRGELDAIRNVDPPPTTTTQSTP
jgi:cell division protein FtsB